jgi:serine/threonine protein kinase
MTERLSSSTDTQIQDDAAAAESRTLSRQSRHPTLLLPGYTFQRCLGDGSFGSVWMAREENTGRLVAVKIYSHHGRLDWTLLSREVEKLAALDSSRHIIGLLAVGWESDPPYYVMEYLEHGSLSGYLSDGPLPVAEAVRIARGVLQGLVHAHGRGILHCDLKPGNVLLDDDLSPRLCDFGQSRLSHEQDPALGTLYYMAPEQADLAALPDARWDVYALGALLYHLLTGSPPYRTPASERDLAAATSLTNRLALYRRLVSDSPRLTTHRQRPGVDGRLADLVDRCLQLHPGDRFPNAQSVLDAFDDRDRRRARRPLIALGGILPLVLMLAMFLFGLSATNDAVTTAQHNLVTRAIESDTVSARIMASGVRRELDSWTRELQEVAVSPRLRELLNSAADRDWARRTALDEYLDAARQLANHRRTVSGRSPDASWFVVDHRGFQRWRGPTNLATLDQHWAHRDYFHGHGREYPVADLPSDLTPIDSPHISLAFESKATSRAIVALSVPITDDIGNVVAILAGTRELGSILSAPYAEYQPSIDAPGVPDASTVARTIAILDLRDGRLLDHPWLQQHVQSAPVVSLDQATRTRLANSQSATTPQSTIRLDNYTDPVAKHSTDFHGRWLAALSPVGNSGWFAVVQERRDQALQPIEAMKRNVLSTWQRALTVSGLVLTVVWGLVLWTLRRTGKPTPPGQRSNEADDTATAFRSESAPRETDA